MHPLALNLPIPNFPGTPTAGFSQVQIGKLLFVRHVAPSILS